MKKSDTELMRELALQYLKEYGGEALQAEIAALAPAEKLPANKATTKRGRPKARTEATLTAIWCAVYETMQRHGLNVAPACDLLAKRKVHIEGTAKLATGDGLGGTLRAWFYEAEGAARKNPDGYLAQRMATFQAAIDRRYAAEKTVIKIP